MYFVVHKILLAETASLCTLIINRTSAFNYQSINCGLHFHNTGFQRWLVLKHLHLTIYKHVQREADSASKILCTTKYIILCILGQYNPLHMINMEVSMQLNS